MIRLILLTDFTEAFSYNLLKGIMEYAKTREPWVVCRMPPSYKNTYGIKGVLRWAKSWNADAIIGRFNDDDDVEVFNDSGIIVVAQDYKNRFPNIPNITGNYIEMGRMAADFFISKGYRSFAFYGYKDFVWSNERCQGFYNYIHEQGCVDSFSIYLEESPEDLWLSDINNLAEWIKTLPHPTALMACDDNLGNRITEICKINNVKVPEKIAVLGVDNDELICNLSDPPLSSISQDIIMGGYEAAKLIDLLIHKRIEDKSLIPDVVLEPISVIDRSSTDLYISSDPHVYTVLKYIRQNLALNIHVSDVVKQVPLSRRLLEIRFKRVTGQSIRKYIFEMKMAKFCQLLIETDKPISELASEIGVVNIKNLSRQFKLVKNVTPQEYRKSNSLKFK